MVKNLITPGQALRRIMAREVAPIYCFFGEDIFFHDIIIEGVLDIADGDRVSMVIGVDSADRVLEHLNINSLFSSKEVIVVRNPKKISPKYQEELKEYCKSPSLDKVLIFIYEDPYSSNKFINSISSHATSIDMRVPFPNKMREWISYYIKREKFDIPDNIINDLIENYGDNTKNVINEIDKLSLSPDDEMKVNINNSRKESQLWKLVDSVGKRDIKSSIEIYTRLYNNNIPLIRIALNLLDLYREIIHFKLKGNSGKFIRNKILLKNLNIYNGKYSMEHLLYSIKLLRDCDYLNKTTSIKEQYLINSILVDICKGENVKN